MISSPTRAGPEGDELFSAAYEELRRLATPINKWIAPGYDCT